MPIDGSAPPLLTDLLRFFFRHFYHGFAWTYDPVAAVVSIGRWKDWIRCSIPYLQAGHVLEIGHGPGHLQQSLHDAGNFVVSALDESTQMGALAKKRLLRAGHTDINLTRGVSQSLPFPAECFDTVVSTFPAEYIFEAATLREIRRVLSRQGRFVLVPAAWIIGRKALDQVAAWLFRATKQVPEFPPLVLSRRIQSLLQDAGFRAESQVVEVRGSEVLVIIARP